MDKMQIKLETFKIAAELTKAQFIASPEKDGTAVFQTFIDFEKRVAEYLERSMSR